MTKWTLVLVAALAAGPRAKAAESSIELDRAGNVKAILAGDRRLTPPSAYSYFELDREVAEAKESGEGGRAYQLTAPSASGIMRVSSDKGTRFHFEPDRGSKAKNISLVLTWPAGAQFHLAEYLNIGRLLDRDMPAGETYEGGLRYNFFVVHSEDAWVRFRAEEKRWQSRASILVARHPQIFTVTFTWESGTDLSVDAFMSMAEVAADTESWMRKEAGMQPLAERPGAPAWVRDIKLVVTADMMRSNWEIANDYQDVLNLAHEISRIRSPREVLFYVPGWQGAYDGVHPAYRPHPELGGGAKFKELMDYLHQAGFRLMIHTTGWGIDPYFTDIDEVERLARRDDKGNMMGWQTPFPEKHPPRVSQKFRTPRIPLPPEASGVFRFQTDPAPDVCEAMFSIGGIEPGPQRIRLTVGRRRLITPTGWFATHREYQFPFPLLLESGRNEVKVEVIGGRWQGGWYQIRDAYGPPTPFQSWTYPILMADVSKPEYIKMYTENVRAVVKEYGIDAVHVDTSTFYAPAGGITPSMREVCYRLRDALPGVALGAEWFRTYEEMNFWQIVQGARMSMKNYLNTERCPCAPGEVMPIEGRAAQYAWLNKPSDVCDFSKKFILIYPHLCAANAFVPVGKVCNILPPRQMPPVKAELWDVLGDALHLNYTPGLRVNYRGFGMDADTRKAIRELP